MLLGELLDFYQDNGKIFLFGTHSQVAAYSRGANEGFQSGGQIVEICTALDKQEFEAEFPNHSPKPEERAKAESNEWPMSENKVAGPSLTWLK